MKVGTAVDTDILRLEGDFALVQCAMYPLQCVGTVGIGHIDVVAIDGQFCGMTHRILIIAVEAEKIIRLTLDTCRERRWLSGRRKQGAVGLARGQPSALCIGKTENHAGYLDRCAGKSKIFLGHLIERIVAQDKLDVKMGLSSIIRYIGQVGKSTLIDIGTQARGVIGVTIKAEDRLRRVTDKRVAGKGFELDISVCGKECNGVVEIDITLSILYITPAEVVVESIRAPFLIDTEATAYAVSVFLAFGLFGDNVGGKFSFLDT